MGSSYRLQVIVHGILHRVGDTVHFADFLPLFFHPNVKQPLGEDTAPGQILVVLLQRVQGLLQGLGQTADFGLFFLRQVKQVEIVGTPAVGFGIDFV